MLAGDAGVQRWWAVRRGPEAAFPLLWQLSELAVAQAM